MAESEEEKRYTLFDPKSKREIKNDYPELRKNKVFKDLNKSQMLFVWFYANEASPLYKIEDDRERIGECIKRSFNFPGSRHKLNGSNVEKFLNKTFGKNIDNGIEEMLKYKLSPRILAKKMVDTTLKNYYAIINVDVTSSSFLDSEGEIDFAKKKSYVDAAATIIKNLDGLIEKAEQGFGITESAEDVGGGGKDDDDLSFADEFHEEK